MARKRKKPRDAEEAFLDEIGFTGKDCTKRARKAASDLGYSGEGLNAGGVLRMLKKEGVSEEAIRGAAANAMALNLAPNKKKYKGWDKKSRRMAGLANAEPPDPEAVKWFKDWEKARDEHKKEEKKSGTRASQAVNVALPEEYIPTKERSDWATLQALDTFMCLNYVLCCWYVVRAIQLRRDAIAATPST